MNPSASCVNCHFFIKELPGNSGRPWKFTATDSERLAAQRGDFSWQRDYSLCCHLGVWDEGIHCDPSLRYHKIAEIARGESCFYWPYTAGMTLDAAEQLQKRANIQFTTERPQLPLPDENISSECPRCGPNRRADVKARHESWSGRDGEPDVSFLHSHYILECRGCQAVFYRRDFHRWDTKDTTSDLYPRPGIEPPSWAEEISDNRLQAVLRELYHAIGNGLQVLAAIGIRTVFDRASEVLGVDANLTFEKKLDRLNQLGKIGAEERAQLGVLVDTGSAAAHRAWEPKPDDTKTLMIVAESFLRRCFIANDPLRELKQSVPPRSPSTKQKATDNENTTDRKSP